MPLTMIHLLVARSVEPDANPASTPAFYTMPILASFAAETEQRYRRWRNDLAR